MILLDCTFVVVATLSFRLGATLRYVKSLSRYIHSAAVRPACAHLSQGDPREHPFFFVLQRTQRRKGSLVAMMTDYEIYSLSRHRTCQNDPSCCFRAEYCFEYRLMMQIVAAVLLSEAQNRRGRGESAMLCCCLCWWLMTKADEASQLGSGGVVDWPWRRGGRS